MLRGWVIKDQVQLYICGLFKTEKHYIKVFSESLNNFKGKIMLISYQKAKIFISSLFLRKINKAISALHINTLLKDFWNWNGVLVFIFRHRAIYKLYTMLVIYIILKQKWEKSKFYKRCDFIIFKNEPVHKSEINHTSHDLDVS